MDWQHSRARAHRRTAHKYDAAEAQAYGRLQGLGWLSPAEERAYLADLQRVAQLTPGMSVLDVGAGTGVMCSLLRRLPALELTALEPSTAMLVLLQASGRSVVSATNLRTATDSAPGSSMPSYRARW